MNETNLGIVNNQTKNPNELLNNKFSFFIKRLPETSYKCVSVNIPEQNGNVVWQNTSLNQLPIAGTGINFEPLTVSFILDEDFNNWSEISYWLRAQSLAINNVDYGNMHIQALGPGPNEGWFSDATITILTNEGVPNIRVEFKDIFPYTLSGINFTNDTAQAEIQIVTATFLYAWFEVERVQ